MRCLMTSEARVLARRETLGALLGFDVVFVGEVHDSPVAHRAELDLLSGLSERDPRLVLALEMFERDVQDVLDAYLKGEIPEDEFLSRSRPWPSYTDDYRPLVELAKAKGLPVVGAGADRRAGVPPTTPAAGASPCGPCGPSRRRRPRARRVPGGSGRGLRGS